MLENSAAKKIRIIFYSLPTIAVFLVTAALNKTPYTKLIWVQIPLHSALEAIGAIVALCLAGFLFSSNNEYPQDFFKIIMSSALIGMGVLGLFHSFVEPGHTFVWLHSTATFLGGVIFSLVWLPQRFFYRLLKMINASKTISSLRKKEKQIAELKDKEVAEAYMKREIELIQKI